MEIHIGDRVADVTLVSKDGNKVQFLIDGEPYDVDIVMAENGSCSILHNGNSYNAELIRSENGKNYTVNMFYRSYNVDIVDTQAKYLRMRKGGEEKQDDKIIAPMPGKVVKIPVKPGDKLSADSRSGNESRRYGYRYRSHEDAEQLQGELRLHRTRSARQRGRLGEQQPGIADAEPLTPHRRTFHHSQTNKQTKT